MLFAGIEQSLQIGRAKDVVRVHKRVIAALRSVNPRIAGSRQALVFLMDHTDALILCRHLVAQLTAAVGGTVVHQNNLKRLVKFLVQDTVDALFQPGLCVVDWHDHTDAGAFHKFNPFQRCNNLLHHLPHGS